MLQSGRPVIFGEVLFDSFPDGREILGGAPFNVAWNLKALGLSPIFISRVGEDPLGRMIKEKMTSWGMDTTYLQSDMNWPTGRVDITLADGEPQFAILPDQAYDQIETPFLQLDEKPAFLYHGSLALRDEISRNTLTELKHKTSCPIFLDVNLRKPWWSRDEVFLMIEDATWLKLNDDECRILFPEQHDLHSCAAMILDKFDLEAVFLTLGNKGAIAFCPGESSCTVKPSTHIDVVDTVGAGDAFSSVLLLGLVQKWPLQTTLTRAQEFASAIVTQRGATLLNQDFYRIFKDKWN